MVSPGQATGKIGEALEHVQMAEENNSKVNIGVLKPCQDPTSRWWSSVMATASHWLMEENDQAAKLYQAVEGHPVS